MAAMARTVPEMVGRALRTMQKAGAIEAKRGCILTKDQQKLQTFLK
jgi:DNA-binding transcriptional regulator YhcF (GntR family)